MIVALYDIRSDKDEMFGNRDEYWHVEDIGKLITHLKETYNVPVWLMGHGHGVKSVASAGAAFTNRIGGVVFSGAGDEVSHRSVEKSPYLHLSCIIKIVIAVLPIQNRLFISIKF